MNCEYFTLILLSIWKFSIRKRSMCSINILWCLSYPMYFIGQRSFGMWHFLLFLLVEYVDIILWKENYIRFEYCSFQKGKLDLIKKQMETSYELLRSHTDQLNKLKTRKSDDVTIFINLPWTSRLLIALNKFMGVRYMWKKLNIDRVFV